MQESKSGWNGELLQSGGGLMEVRSTVKLNWPRIRQLSEAAVTALEQTAEALHTEVVQAQVMPFDTGHLEEDATFIDYSESANGKVSIVSSTPYARRLYYHPEYHFQKYENPFESGLLRGFREVLMQISHKTHSRDFIRKQVVSDADITGDPGLDRDSGNRGR